MLGAVLRGGHRQRATEPADRSLALRIAQRGAGDQVEADLHAAVGGVHRLTTRTRRLGEPLLEIAFRDAQPVGDAGTRAQHEAIGHRLRHSIAGQVSITIGMPAARVRSKASSSITPSWNQTPFAPTATASSANCPAFEERRNTSTTSMAKGTSARVAYPCSPSTVGALGWIGTICFPRSWSRAEMRYAVRLVSPDNPTIAQILQSSSMKSTVVRSCQLSPTGTNLFSTATGGGRTCARGADRLGCGPPGGPGPARARGARSR